ncbi:inactive receptor-like serine/threonine-protein kinase At2g40270 [Prosopis cineraria]|uniref:inactive receptor-like serine/threonine-protein kinase At2g40270 n=1 Tax=Prosopis cineraria TaxID=364024 RepID=UPI00240F7576|nr:inactive receptor-like serine/threonine-protein kinase At2g40270 [Prosopis cineraria]
MKEEAWCVTRLKLRTVVFMAAISLFSVFTKQSLCLSLNNQGLALLRFRDRVINDPFGALSNWKANDGAIDPCSWFGVECSEGKIVTLNLKDLCLQGTIALEIAKLTHIKAIILRNNSFFGEIPKEIIQLKELEVLDLGYNNFSGSFPFETNLSLTTILLDNNDYLANLTPDIVKSNMISETHSNQDLSKTSCVSRSSLRYKRQLLQISNSPTSLPPDSQVFSPSPSIPPFEAPSSSPSASAPISFPPFSSPSPSIFHPPAPSSSPSPSPVPSPSPIIEQSPEISPANPPFDISNPPESNGVPAPSPDLFSNQGNSKAKHRSVIIWSTIGGFSLLVLVSAIAFACFCNTKVVTVKPWPISLSGQLQKAFVTGVPSLKRAELESACEDFSNIIGSLPEGTIYKGTLSSGIEIAVVSTSIISPQNFSKHMEAQFKKKLETLSRLNHKNFVNLIGFCEEKQPFTRMMVFEYAPNGTLYEHLHIREAEQLDWAMRVRIAMGIAYCLEYMHQLTPPIAHTNLKSSSICLTEDYAAKISDLSFWSDIVTSIKKGSSEATRLLETPLAYTKGNVYSFGLILFELITGKVPYTEEDGILSDWAAEYIRWGKKPLIDVVDPTLTTLKEEEIEKWFQVMIECAHSDPDKRPTMREVTAKLKEITAMEPDEAIPKLSPLWWAELEIKSGDLS